MSDSNINITGAYVVIEGRVEDRLLDWPDATFDACLCDPPYGLKFMGKHWDHGVPSVEIWREVFRVLKPGAFLMAFGGTRTYHRLSCAIEDAGFEIRDCLMWLYGSGFPKSLDISKAIDKLNGDTRQIVGSKLGLPGYSLNPNLGAGVAMSGNVDGSLRHPEKECQITSPGSDESAAWQGYGTALKPAWEPIILAMKPCEGTFAQNALTYGVAGLDIDGGRIEGESVHTSRNIALGSSSGGIYQPANQPAIFESHPAGRWPANLILSHTPWCRVVTGDDQGSTSETNDDYSNIWTEESRARIAQDRARNKLLASVVFDCHPLCPVRLLDEQSGISTSSGGQASLGAFRSGMIYGSGLDIREKRNPGIGDTGGASRFFYTAKVSTRERNLGGIDCKHPTLKPISITSYLATLLLPPASPDSLSHSPPHSPRSLLTPFSGAGSEIIGGLIAGWDLCVGIEMEPEYVEWANARIAGAVAGELDKESAAYRSARERRSSTSIVSVSTSVDSSSAPRPRRRRSSSTSAIDAEALNSLGLDAEPEIIESMRVDEVAEVTKAAEEVEDDA